MAYLSANFCRHPVGYLIAGLFEHHDRSRIEPIGISFGPSDDNSEVRGRIIRSFATFRDVTALSDADAAAIVHDMNVDIAVDLMGHTAYARPGILAFRPAPIQVEYLGYPGPMNADFIDYVIADKVERRVAMCARDRRERSDEIDDVSAVEDRSHEQNARGVVP